MAIADFVFVIINFEEAMNAYLAVEADILNGVIDQNVVNINKEDVIFCWDEDKDIILDI